MKKVLLFGLISIASAGMFTVFGQKATTRAKVTANSIPTIKSEADTISYAYGAAIVEGLPAYLTQLGVLVDAEAIKAEYASRIEAELDKTKKTKLEKESLAKVDSVTKANDKNINDFIAGFKKTMTDNTTSKSFQTGITVAGQVSGSLDNFSKEIIGNEKAFNRDAFIYAFVAALKKDKPLVNIENPQALIQEKAQLAQQRKEIEEGEKLQIQFSDKIAENTKFMAENKTKPGVVTLASGLQYKVITEGTGAKPTATDVVKVHYKGTLLDGTPFDSSYDRGEPATFSVGQVIKGWTEALTLMPVGSKWILYIPYDLAYGARDQGTIKPFSNLIFEVELLDIINQDSLNTVDGE